MFDHIIQFRFRQGMCKLLISQVGPSMLAVAGCTWQITVPQAMPSNTCWVISLLYKEDFSCSGQVVEQGAQAQEEEYASLRARVGERRPSITGGF